MTEAMQDIEIKCVNEGCTQVRVFTVRDQKFYAEKKFSTPKRCRFHSEQERKRHDEKVEEAQQVRRDDWVNDRGRGSRVPGAESDAEMLGD